MSVSIGTRLGTYEIIAPLGSGGMGEVYRARDTQLKREVAIKILPAAFAQDPERVGRFQREAELLATLNHPNIAAVYGVERSSGVDAIVLELVEGETLGDRLERGPLPVHEALAIARQIIEALEAAHEKGIVHRDLKPANVKVTSDDRVKVLDFGLARLMTDDAPAASTTLPEANATHSPTLSMMATQAGVILGTAAYMSPEQAKGLPADHRSDVFSFGCVLYEMLTGRQPFHGETAPDILASVVARDPDFAALPPHLNPRLGELLKRCLAKPPKRRWQAVGDLRWELETIGSAPTAPPVPAIGPRRSGALLAGLMLAVTVASGLAGVFAGTRVKSAAAVDVVRLSVPIPNGQRFTSGARRRVGIRPDGAQMVYVANDQLFIRDLSQLEPRALPGSGGRQGIQGVAFSPDGKEILYYSLFERMLKRIATTGGPAIAVTPIGSPAGMSWGQDGILLGAGANAAILRVNPNGGSPKPLIQLSRGEVAFQPELLPGGRAVMFTVSNTFTDFTNARVVVQAIGSSDRKVVAEAGSDARYLPTGHVIYAVGGALFARRFDVQRLEASGSPVPIVEGVERGTGALAAAVAQYSVSDTGSLIYAPGPASVAQGQRRVVFIDQTGKTTPLDLPPRSYDSPRFSPDGKHLSIVIDDGKQAHIHVYDLAGGTSLRQLTFEGRNRFPLWSPDSQRIVFQSNREGDDGIWWQRADGTGVAERLTKADKETSHVPESFLGHTDVFSLSVIQPTDTVLLRTFAIGERKSEAFGALTSTAPLNSEFSPDGRWLAYTLRDTSGANVYVQPVPPTGAKYLASTAGGHHPEWSRDGTRLLYFPGGDPIVSAPVTTRNGFAVGNPAPIPGAFISFTSTQSARNHDVSPDGSRIAAVFYPGDTSAGAQPQQINVVLGWFEDLKQRMAAK